MLDYMNVLTSKDKEVRDPVSGHAFPMSVNDVHSMEVKREADTANRDMFNKLIALTK